MRPVSDRPLVEALRRQPLDRPPVWLMRQAGRYLPEYRRLRASHTFQEAVSTPRVAAEITLQPVRRFGMDGAVIFADIMTPLEAMGVEMTFDPGPRLAPYTVAAVAALGELDVERLDFIGETIRLVCSEVDEATAVIGFAGGPVTLLAYLLDGGGSRDFMGMRSALTADLPASVEALAVLGRAMNRYLGHQVEAGAHVVQLFDSWAGLLGREPFGAMAVPAARQALSGLAVPRIYFAPGAGHTLDLQAGVGAEGFGVDWRLPLDTAWEALGDVAIQGNLDPAVLFAGPRALHEALEDLLGRAGGRPGHVVNLGHGIHPATPPEQVATLVEAVQTRP